MSLTVPDDLAARAVVDEVDDAAFVACVRDSLPYAYRIVQQLAQTLHNQTGEWVEHTSPPPGDKEQGQLFRALASDAIRGGLERHFAVRLSFQNCHRVAAFRPEAVGGDAYCAFVSAAGQLRNQTPELRNC